MADPTKLEKLDLLCKVAHAMGFHDAKPAYWDVAQPECPMETIDEAAENGEFGTPYEAELGIFLGAPVFVVQREGTAGEHNIVTDIFDTAEAAQEAGE